MLLLLLLFWYCCLQLHASLSLSLCWLVINPCIGGCQTIDVMCDDARLMHRTGCGSWEKERRGMMKPRGCTDSVLL